ncbi:MAG: hypothetical protein N2V72_00445 [Methanophagales archaeon]|nr:hypothetical protein [Methanophagales archaeon]
MIKIEELAKKANPALRLYYKPEGVKIMPEKRYNEVLNILQKEEPTHYERLWLVGYLKWLGFNADEVMDIIDNHNNWLDYKRNITWYQICSVFKTKAIMPNTIRQRKLREREKIELPTLSERQQKELQRAANLKADELITQALRERYNIVWYPWESEEIRQLDRENLPAPYR